MPFEALFRLIHTQAVRRPKEMDEFYVYTYYNAGDDSNIDYFTLMGADRNFHGNKIVRSGPNTDVETVLKEETSSIYTRLPFPEIVRVGDLMHAVRKSDTNTGPFLRGAAFSKILERYASACNYDPVQTRCETRDSVSKPANGIAVLKRHYTYTMTFRPAGFGYVVGVCSVVVSLEVHRKT